MKDNIIVFSTADWDNPFWTNKQHVTMQLAEMNYKILYVESVGIREITITVVDLLRIFKKLQRVFKPLRFINNNILVWTPFVIPLKTWAIVNLLNRLLFKFQLSIIKLFYFGMSKPILWTYNPLTPMYVSFENYSKIIYHSVDDVSQQPHMPRELIRNQESILVHSADYIFTTSTTLYNKLIPINKETFYFPNVVDFDFFNSAVSDDVCLSEDLMKIPEPRIGFIGAISGYKLDFDLIKKVVSERPNYNFVFIGKIGEGDPFTTIDQINTFPNIYFLGPKKYSSLPSYLKGFSACIIPCSINDYTASMFPMKFFEYLAAGKYVICTDLPSLSEFHDLASICKNAEEFIAGIDIALTKDDNINQKGIDAASENTYYKRTVKMLRIAQL